MITAKCIKDFNPFDGARYPEIEIGKEYIVQEISMGASFTHISLKGIPDRWYNSICFEFYEDNSPLDIYRDKRFYPVWKNPQGSF